MDLEQLTVPELLQRYREAMKEYESWKGSTDGSDGACWCNVVWPIIKELKRRGFENEIDQ